MKYFYILLFIITCINCNTSQKDIEKIIQKWYNKEILFPDDLTAHINGRDTIINYLTDNSYKILHYIDTCSCYSCNLKFHEWKKILTEIDSLSLDIPIIYIVFAECYKEIEHSQFINKFSYPIYYDRHGKTNQINNFPHNPKMR